MHDSVAAIAATGVSPLVRIPSNEAWMVKRALDTGAHGIVVPLLDTVADAERLASAAKFPPVGTRGFGSPFAAQSFVPRPPSHHRNDDDAIPAPISATRYLLDANAGLVTVAQIETRTALANAAAIAAVPGIDVLLVGPFDLGNAIGAPVLDADGAIPEPLMDAIRAVHTAATDAGKVSGIYCTSGEQARGFADQGFGMVCVAADVVALQAHVGRVLAVARGEAS